MRKTETMDDLLKGNSSCVFFFNLNESFRDNVFIGAVLVGKGSQYDKVSLKIIKN